MQKSKTIAHKINPNPVQNPPNNPRNISIIPRGKFSMRVFRATCQRQTVKYKHCWSYKIDRAHGSIKLRRIFHLLRMGLGLVCNMALVVIFIFLNLVFFDFLLSKIHSRNDG